MNSVLRIIGSITSGVLDIAVRALLSLLFSFALIGVLLAF